MNEAIAIETLQKTPPKKYPQPEPYPVNCGHPCCYGCNAYLDEAGRNGPI